MHGAAQQVPGNMLLLGGHLRMQGGHDGPDLFQGRHGGDHGADVVHMGLRGADAALLLLPGEEILGVFAHDLRAALRAVGMEHPALPLFPGDAPGANVLQVQGGKVLPGETLEHGPHHKRAHAHGSAVHGGLLALLHQDHLPVLGDVVLDGGHGPGVVDDHDGHAGEQQRLDEDAHALFGFMGDFLHVVHQGVHGVGDHFHADGAAGFVVDDLPQLPVRLGDILA